MNLKKMTDSVARFFKSMDRVQITLICVGIVAVAAVILFVVFAPKTELPPAPGDVSSELEEVSSSAPVLPEGSSGNVKIEENVNDTLAGYSIYEGDFIGVFDSKGVRIAKSEYNVIGTYVGDGWLPVTKEDMTVDFIDFKTGNIALSTKYKAASYFSDGYAAVSLNMEENEEYYIYGYIDKQGKVLHDINLATGRAPGEGGLAVASPNDTKLYGFVDKTGKFVIPAKFNNVGSFRDGIAPAAKDDKWGFIDMKGNFIIKPSFDKVSWFSEGLARVQVNEKWGFVDAKGNFVIDTIFDYATDFKNGAAAVKVGEKCGYINLKGEYIIEPKYDNCCDFYYGLAAVQWGGKWGFIDTKGNFVIEPQYDSTGDFYEGIVWVEQNDAYVYLDTQGNQLWDTVFTAASDFVSGQAVVGNNGLYGVIDKSGKYVIQPQHTLIKEIYYASES